MKAIFWRLFKLVIFALLVPLLHTSIFASDTLINSSVSSGGTAGSVASTFTINDIIGSCYVSSIATSGSFTETPDLAGIGQYQDTKWLTWYLAEGATLNDFSEWICIQNPNTTAADVTVTFMKSDGSTVVETIEVGATSRYTINANAYVPNESISTKVQSTNGVGIIVERAMYRTSGGIEWVAAHCSIGANSPATTWFLAEGATLNDFSEWVCIQNPNNTAADVTVTFMKGDGSTVVSNIEVGATSRYTINVNTVVPNEEVSTKVESTNGVGVIVERAMYRTSGGIDWVAAHASIGATSTSETWYLAEGATLNGFDEWVCIQNPNNSAADVTVTFMKSDGTTEILNIEIGATSRYTIHVNDYVPNESVSTKVESTNGVGVIAERAMYRTTGGIEWACAHASIGATDTATTWYLAEGATLNDFSEWVCIQNPNNTAADVTVTFMKSDGSTVEVNIEVSATSRYTINVNDYVPNESVSTEVESTNNVGVIVERAMYRTSGGIEWVAGHCSVGVPE